MENGDIFAKIKFLLFSWVLPSKISFRPPCRFRTPCSSPLIQNMTFHKSHIYDLFDHYEMNCINVILQFLCCRKCLSARVIFANICDLFDHNELNLHVSSSCQFVKMTFHKACGTYKNHQKKTNDSEKMKKNLVQFFFSTSLFVGFVVPIVF